MSDTSERWKASRESLDDVAGLIQEHVPTCPACGQGRACGQMKQWHLVERATYVYEQTLFGIMSQYANVQGRIAVMRVHNDDDPEMRNT
jgi:hypothetical protein